MRDPRDQPEDPRIERIEWERDLPDPERDQAASDRYEALLDRER